MLNLGKLIPARTRPKPAKSAEPIGPVFVSHSSKNKRLAAAVVAELESNGIRCWFAPRDIRPGDPNYGGAILDGLSSCKAMLLLLTEPSNSSQHVMKESERAVNRNLPILVVRFQPIEVSRDLEYYVSSAQFLDATEEPTQKHFPIIRHHVRDMLTRPTRAPQTDQVSIVVTPRKPRRRPRWGLRLLGLGAIAAIAAGLLVDAPVQLPPLVEPAPESSEADATEATAEAPREPDLRQDEAPASTGAIGSLLAGVRDKAKTAGSLEKLAKTKLANFHREALLVSKSGALEPGNVSPNDVEVMASCQIRPNMNGYTSLANSLIPLLDKACQEKGSITSDGLKTSERQGLDARPIVQTLGDGTLFSTDGLQGIFASDAHQTLVRDHATKSTCRYVAFPSLFLLYDEPASGDQESGVSVLRDNWYALNRQKGTGIVVILDSTKNSFRHTSWRWFHLPPPEWSIVASHCPVRFKCVFTTTDSKGVAVESDYYPLTQYGLRVLTDWNGPVIVLAPFFVESDFSYYIPEIKLTKSVVVTPDDVTRIKDFSVTLEEVPAEAR
jgi:hypothetical protein